MKQDQNSHCHQTGQEQSLSAISQDKIIQVPWHTQKPTHITHTPTHSVSHVLWHTSTQTNTLTHTNTHTQTRDWFCTYTHKHTHTNTRLKLFSRSRHKHTHTHTITETTLPENLDRTTWIHHITYLYNMWVNISDGLKVDRHFYKHTTLPENMDMTTSHTYTLCEWISVMMICT